MVGNQKCGVYWCVMSSHVLFCLALCGVCVFGRIGLGVPVCGFGSGLLYTILFLYILYNLSGHIAAIYICAYASYIYAVSITQCKRYMAAVYKVPSRMRDAARVRCPWDSLRNKKYNEGDTGTPKETTIPIRKYHELEDKPQERRKVEKEEKEKIK